MAGHARYTALLDACVLYPLPRKAASRTCGKKPQACPEDFAFALELGGLPTTAERLRLAAELI